MRAWDIHDVTLPDGRRLRMRCWPGRGHPLVLLHGLFDDAEGWVNLRHGEMEIALMRGEPVEDGGVAHVDVADVKAEAERLREAGVDIGVVFELHGEIRLLDVFDPDGNRIQLAQDVAEQPAP